MSYVGTSYSDVDESPTKTYIVSRQGDPTVKPFFDLAFEQRPREELYDLVQDPGELVNVAAVPQYAELREQLSARLHAALAATGDPRAAGGGEAFDQYPYYGRVITPPLTTNVDELDPFVHGAQIFTLDAGPAYAFYHYAVLGSLSGTSPGTSLGGVLVPLNPDPYLQLTMSSPALFFVNSVGTLDASGRATATLPMPANPAFGYLFLPGRRLHHAYVLSTGEPPSYALASNPCQLRMLYPPRGPYRAIKSAR